MCVDVGSEPWFVEVDVAAITIAERTRREGVACCDCSNLDNNNHENDGQL